MGFIKSVRQNGRSMHHLEPQIHAILFPQQVHTSDVSMSAGFSGWNLIKVCSSDLTKMDSVFRLCQLNDHGVASLLDGTNRCLHVSDSLIKRSP